MKLSHPRAGLSKKIKLPGIVKDLEAIVSLTAASRTALKQKAIQWVNDLENFPAQCQILIQTLDRIDRK